MVKEANKKTEKFWRNLWQLLEPSQGQIKKLFILIIVFELFRLVGPYILKMIVDRLAHFNKEEIFSIISLAVLMFLSEEVVSLIAYVKDKLTFKILINIEYYLPVRAHKKLMELSLGYHEKENTGAKITRIERGMNKISELLGNMSFEVVPTILQLFVTVVVLLIVDWRLGISLAFFAPLFIFITYKVNKDLRPVRKERYRNNEIASGKMTEAVININTVKSFSQEAKEVKNFRSIKNMIKARELWEWFRVLRLSLGRNFLVDSGRIIILLIGIYLVWQGAVSIGTLIFVITLSEKSYLSLNRLSRFYDRVQEGREAVSRLVYLIKERTDIINPKNGLKPKSIGGEIKFKGVVFFYKDSREMALNNTNLTISAGCVTALVGSSGGGKTTVARMIYRHYDPQGGEVLLDNKNLKDYDLYAFRKFIAIVPQEVEIFNTAVSENIAYANPKAGFKEIQAAARIANAEEFIMRLPGRYDTLVGERGIKLSGGQRQRVGIARAILANPKILIFDEATSSLDSYNEKLIQEAIERVSRGRTMIIIAHRLSTISRADKIAVIEGGKVVEQGSHIELASKKGGLYAKLLKLQEIGDIT